MDRHFNTAGPCRPEIHYTLPPERRLPEVRRLVDAQHYFVLHAPRQVGKTTALRALAASLTAEGRYAAVMVSMETGAAFPTDIGAAEFAIVDAWRRAAEHLPRKLAPPPWPDAPAGSRIASALNAWTRACPRPLVVFLDEIDALRDMVLLSVLRQLRDGHPTRPEGFPWSLALVGLRDVRDYKVASGGSPHLQTNSPFNIKAESLSMREFTADEVGELYAQHTAATGQRFDEGAVARAHALTEGQPWLVNALARQCVEVLVTDRATAITADDIDRAKEILLQRQDTHLDSLVERLREPRVRAVIEPLIAGDLLPDVPDDDRRYVIDLGLLRESPTHGLVVANAIYREVIPRALARSMAASLPYLAPIWQRPDGTLDAQKLCEALVSFWREHGEILQASAPYAEVAAQLAVMAFLQRVVNGGGRVEREYAVGRGRIDVLVVYRGLRLAIELKAWRDRDKKRDVLAKGLAQLDEYIARTQAPTAWIILFDQRSGQPDLADRISVEATHTPQGRAVTLLRL